MKHKRATFTGTVFALLAIASPLILAGGASAQDQAGWDVQPPTTATVWNPGGGEPGQQNGLTAALTYSCPKGTEQARLKIEATQEINGTPVPAKGASRVHDPVCDGQQHELLARIETRVHDAEPTSMFHTDAPVTLDVTMGYWDNSPTGGNTTRLTEGTGFTEEWYQSLYEKSVRGYTEQHAAAFEVTTKAKEHSSSGDKCRQPLSANLDAVKAMHGLYGMERNETIPAGLRTGFQRVADRIDKRFTKTEEACTSQPPTVKDGITAGRGHVKDAKAKLDNPDTTGLQLRPVLDTASQEMETALGAIQD